MLIFIAGATGFVGSHLLGALKEKGHSVRCLVRSPEKASLCEKNGFEAVSGDITSRESLRGRLDGADMVVHLVGIIEEKGSTTFGKVHVEGTGNLVEEARSAGVSHFFYQSALGASLDSSSRYQKTKAEAEEIVKGSGIPYTIFRPSLVIGEGDGFTERLKELLALGPLVTIPGDGMARFQPLFIDDWVKCFLGIVGNESSKGKTYELGGPEQLTYNQIISDFMEAAGTRKPVIHVPMALMKAGLPFMGFARGLAMIVGKKIPLVTADQLALLERDNICDLNAVEKAFGFKPVPYKEALKTSLR